MGEELGVDDGPDESLGTALGMLDKLGWIDGDVDGSKEKVGFVDGDVDGALDKVGFAVGTSDGALEKVGDSEGFALKLGAMVGPVDGSVVGTVDGVPVGPTVGYVVGSIEGTALNDGAGVSNFAKHLCVSSYFKKAAFVLSEKLLLRPVPTDGYMILSLLLASCCAPRLCPISCATKLF